MSKEIYSSRAACNNGAVLEEWNGESLISNGVNAEFSAFDNSRMYFKPVSLPTWQSTSKEAAAASTSNSYAALADSCEDLLDGRDM